MKTVVVAGCGFGGIDVAVQVKRAFGDDVRVVAIDAKDYHTLHGLLLELVSRKIGPDDINVPLEPYFRVFGVEFLCDKIVEFRLDHNELILEEEGVISFDYLLLDLGAVVNDFGIAGIKEHAFSVKPYKKALALSYHIEQLFERFDELSDKKKKQAMRFVVAGAGPSGIELATELVDFTLDLAKKYKVPQHLLEWHIVDAAENPFVHFGKAADKLFRKTLFLRGIQLHTNCRVQEVFQDKVVTSSGTFKTETFVFLGGFKPHPILQTTGLSLDRRGAVNVNDFLQSVSNPNVFATGDNACFINKQTKRAVEQTAMMAVIEEPIVSHNIIAAIRGDGLKKFKPKKSYSLFVTTGKDECIYVKAPFAFNGQFFFHWKKKIHGKYAAKYTKALDPRNRLQVLHEAKKIKWG